MGLGKDILEEAAFELFLSHQGLGHEDGGVGRGGRSAFITRRVPAPL